MPMPPVSGERLGPMIRRLRTAGGLSEDELAERLNRAAGRDTVSRTEVWRWETEYEGRTPGPLWLPHLAAVLGAPADTLRAAKAVSQEKRKLSALSDRPSSTDVLARLLASDEPLPPTGTSAGRRISAGDAEALLRRVHGLRLADDVLAGGDLVEIVLRELRAARELYAATSHTEAVGAQLLAAISELAQLAGWVATDTGGTVDAAPLFRLGVQAARQAGDGPLTAHLLGSWGYWRAEHGDARGALDLVKAASGEPAGGLRAQSLMSSRLAWTSALAGDVRGALYAIGQSMDFIYEAEPDEDAGRQWLYWLTAAEQEVMEARVYTRLHRPLRAVPLLRRVLSSYDATHIREYALYSSWLSVALADGGEPEEAASVAARVLELVARVPSSRAADRGSAMLAALRPYADVPEVAEVLRAA